MFRKFIFICVINTLYALGIKRKGAVIGDLIVIAIYFCLSCLITSISHRSIKFHLLKLVQPRTHAYLIHLFVLVTKMENPIQ